MDYVELEKTSVECVKDIMKKEGLNQEEAVYEYLDRLEILLKRGDFGLNDYRNACLIFGYNYPKYMNKTYEKLRKKVIDVYCGKGLKELKKQGVSKQDAYDTAFWVNYGFFQNGAITLEEFDGVAWALGYPLSKKFFHLSEKEQKEKPLLE